MGTKAKTKVRIVTTSGEVYDFTTKDTPEEFDDYFHGLMMNEPLFPIREHNVRINFKAILKISAKRENDDQ